MGIDIKLQVNGGEFSLLVEKNWPLLYVLREKLFLTGAKNGCGTGDCGACTVLIDGEARTSCNIPAFKAEGKKIVTIEGLVTSEMRLRKELHPVQQAFIDAGAVQCGFCTPGMVLTAVALLHKNPNPDEGEIRRALAKNICRCTGYVKIVEAVHLAAERMKKGRLA